MEAQEGPPVAPQEDGPLYSIKEVSELTDVPAHTIRLWDRKLPGFLAPHRTPGGQRRFTEECVERIRKLDYYVNQKGMTPVGARRRIEEGIEPESHEAQELREIILADRRVRQAIDEIVELIRKKLLDAV
ncbi:MAG: MerR family transcriptional regulator [Deltaproteobacteria bacterium]|nr:MerR family transcriptional regulator [Deltaproteobacteria bacterium]